MEFLQSMFASQGLHAQGHGTTWTPAMLWTMVGADALIAASYFSIPLAIAAFLRRRGRRSNDWMAWLFVAFILACGVTHAMHIWVIWFPDYGMQAVAKIVTAIISLGTAAALWPMLPTLAKMRSAEELQRVVDRLRAAEAQQRQLLADTQRTAQQLALSEQRYRSLFDRNPDAVYAFDTQGNFTSMNPACEALTGLTAEEALSGNFLPIIAPECVQHTMACFARAVAGEATRYETTGIHRDGSRFIADVTNLPIFVNGEIVGVFGIAKDVSARKLAERRQREEEQRFATIVAEAATGIAVTDVDGRFLRANAAYCQMVGYTLAELQQRNLRELTHPDDRARNEDLLQDAMARDPGSFVMEKRYIGKSGAVNWVRASVTIIRDEDRKPLHIVGILEDITQSKAAAEALQRSQALVGIAGRVSQVGGWSVDLPDQRVTWSDVVAAIHDEPAGFSPDLATAIDYYRPSDRETIRHAFGLCVSHGLPYDLELQIVTAAGRLRWVRVVGEAVCDADGAIYRVQGAFQDLSDRKSVEAENETLTRRLTQMLASITDGFFTVDRESRFSYVNAEAERLLGKRVPDLLGREAWSEFPQDRGGDLERQLRRAVVERRTVTFETWLATRQVWLRLSAYPSDDGLVVFFRDISAEREARTELELLQASVSRLHDIVLITEAAPADGTGARIVFVNDAFLRVTGYGRQEVIGRSPGLLHGPLTDAGTRDRIRKALQRVEPAHAELIHYGKDGQPYWVEIDIVPVNQQGGSCSHFVAVMRDITERKHHEQEMRELNAELETRVRLRTAEADQARQDAERANRAKSEFLATMSHEIRTPMNGVVGMIDVLEHSALDDEQRQVLGTARESAYALLNIVDDVLDISKIEAGQLELEQAPVDPVGVIEHACLSFEWMAAQKGVRLALFVDPALPRRVLGDAHRLRQVLLNLIGNAIKFSSGLAHEGQVAVRAAFCPLSVAPTLRVQIVDNGVGIGREGLERLFAPFTQAESGTTRRFGGTGLGLTISRALLEKMGGQIAVDSEPGRGSSFVVSLPLRALLPLPGSDADAATLAGVTCLLIGVPAQRAADLCSYLQHSAALARSVPDLASALRFLAAQDRGRCVCILWGSRDSALALEAELRDRARAMPPLQLGCVRLDSEHRERLRSGVVDRLSLPADLLLRQDLVAAVQAAAPPAAPATAPTTAPDAGRDREADALPPATSPSPSTPEPAEPFAAAVCRGARILVAEDNDVNRQVLLRQLHLLGVSPDLAANGKQALEMWRRDEHLLLLTDLHMPEMDGYALARAVRLAEAGRQRMPIVALTANALNSESQRCTQAGMDDYMTKPVRLEKLRDMLVRWLPREPAQAAAARTPADVSAAPAGAAVDLRRLEDLVGSDPEVIGELLEVFQRGAEQAGTAMRQACAGADWRALADAAHTLKSGARSVGALRLGDLCEQLESLGAARDGDAAGLLMPDFLTELDAVSRLIRLRLQPPGSAGH